MLNDHARQHKLKSKNYTTSVVPFGCGKLGWVGSEHTMSVSNATKCTLTLNPKDGNSDQSRNGNNDNNTTTTTQQRQKPNETTTTTTPKTKRNIVGDILVNAPSKKGIFW